MTLPLTERIQIAADRAVHAKYFFDVWYLYKVERPRIANTLNEYAEFFGSDIRAHFLSFVVAACGCLDSRTDTVGFQHLMAEMQRSNRISPAEFRTLSKLIEKAMPVHEKLKHLRHKLYAHRDSSLTHDDAFREANVKYAEARRHVDRLLKIANQLLRANGMGSVDVSLSPVHDLKRLLDVLAGKAIFPQSNL